MLYRVFVGGVIAFWLVMSALLLRLELSPERSEFFNVPLSHVVKLVFLHEQPSVLSIYEQGEQIGSLLLRPKRHDEKRELNFSGNIALGLPWTERQRVSWNGRLEMNKKLDVQTLEIEFSSREPVMETRFSADLDSGIGRYEMRQQNELIQRALFRLEEWPALAQRFGLSETVISNARVPKITARPAEMRIGNEKIEAYLITLARDQEKLAEIYVSQLGQVLKANTSFGYSLSAEDILP